MQRDLLFFFSSSRDLDQQFVPQLLLMQGAPFLSPLPIDEILLFPRSNTRLFPLRAPVLKPVFQGALDGSVSGVFSDPLSGRSLFSVADRIVRLATFFSGPCVLGRRPSSRAIVVCSPFPSRSESMVFGELAGRSCHTSPALVRRFFGGVSSAHLASFPLS